MVVLGSMSLGGNIVPVENLAESLAGRLRRRGQAPAAADGEREGHPDDPRRVVRQVPDGLLRRPDGCGVQGAGRGVKWNPCAASMIAQSLLRGGAISQIVFYKTTNKLVRYDRFNHSHLDEIK